MKFFVGALTLLTLVTSYAQANTPPPISVMQLYGGPTNGIVQSTGGILGALNCGSNANYVPTWNVSGYFECAVGGGGGSGLNQLTGDVTAGPGTGSQAATVVTVGGQTASNVAAGAVLANAATNANTVSAIVKRDGSGNFSAGTITAALTGNASTASALAANPNDCSANQYATAIAANGDFTCAQPAYTSLTGQLSFTAPLVNTAGTVTCTDGSGSVKGCITAADWTTFNGKQASGNYITALTGDLTASGPGSAASTLATVNSNVGSFTNASITVNAKGLVTAASSGAGSSGDVVGPASATDSAIALFNTTTGKLIKNSAVTVSGSTVTGSLTGAASLNVLKAGDTMTGDLILTTAANGITIGAATTKSKSLYIKPGASGTGIQLENVNNTRKFNIDVSNAGFTLFGQDATNGMLAVSNVATGGTGVNWFSFGGNGAANPPPYPKHFNTISADGNVTALSSVKSLDGNNINDAPWVVLGNLNATVNTIVGWVTTGSSKNPMSFFGSRNIVQTASSEDADAIIANQNAGTLTEHVRVKPKGQIVTLGTAPAAGTCGTSPGTPTGNDNGFKIVSGTGGVSGSCAVTLATAPTNDGKCICEDETSAFNVKTTISGSTVTMTTYSATTGIAGNFTASDVFKCICHYW